ncbi:hypothetical protein KBX06_02040 [Micromonospora sp. C31]|uniref:hypothetical protein n=1 Tax=Micromonospora sp. C31 TaxID=2824876 RepID=UPI001B35900C|nr:hypothetical protein [Micromonospora sp. C31]MBQ1071952.1 hypothetical protein [Micromonospora sp. C31]
MSGRVPRRRQQPYARSDPLLAVDHPELAGGAQRRDQAGRQPRVELPHGGQLGPLEQVVGVSGNASARGWKNAPRRR